MTTCSKCGAFISHDSFTGPMTCATCQGTVVINQPLPMGQWPPQQFTPIDYPQPVDWRKVYKTAALIGMLAHKLVQR
jgi:hypothetical protein